MNMLRLLLVSVCMVLSANGMELLEKNKTVGITLVNTVDLRKNQRAELEKSFAEIKRRESEALKKASRLLTQITNELSLTHAKLKDAAEGDLDYLNRKIAVLNDRKQNIIDYQESWKEYVEVITSRLKLQAEVIEFLQASKGELKPAYSWKDFRDNQIKIAEQAERIETSKLKRENIRKQKIATHEKLLSREKQLASKQKEREKLVSHVDSADKIISYDSSTVKQQSDILSQELDALSESIEFIKILAEKLDAESRYWDDVAEYEQQRFNDFKSVLEKIEGRLVLDFNDVENAKQEWKNQALKALELKEQINQIREPKKREKEKFAVELDILKEKLAQLKKENIDNRADVYTVKAQIKLAAAKYQVLEKEIMLLDAKRDLADTIATERELQYNIIEVRYRLRIEAENIDEFFNTFSMKRDLALSALKEVRDNRTQAINSLIETNHTLDRMKNNIEKLRTRRSQALKGKDGTVKELLTLFEQSMVVLSKQLSLTQAYLAVNADLIKQHERIKSQYELIMQDLENKRRTYSIWKRSPKAISADELLRAIIEAETFFKKLYWETPSHIRPSIILNNIKQLGMRDLVMIVLMIIIYLALFIGLRFVIDTTKRHIVLILDRYKGRARYLYMHLFIAFLDFARQHYTLVFTWFFIFLGLKFEGAFFFAGLLPILSTYSVTVFYLLSIPFLLYFSHCFIKQLRELNAGLSYLFFAERLQDKFIVLVSIFCYATSILVPLKLALDTYTETAHTEFSTVIVAAYSLILLVVIALLFGKEDVLKFMPSQSGAFLTLKRKVDKHYYPVFFFVMTLLILSNSYIGYWNMAWFLAFAVPSTVALVYLLFSLHYYIRKYAIFLFMKEDEDEFVDKFEHAKAYYGFFVIFSFIVLMFAIILSVSYIWQFDYTPTDLWDALSQRWVIRFGADGKLGFVEFMILGTFVAAGFLISSLAYRFILSKLFDILRSEPGTQNTISRISHYTIVFVSMLLGLNAMHLEQFIFWVSASFGIALGFALKDIGADLVSGFFVLIERPIEIGNYIQIDNIQGTVHKISARSTTVITSKNHSVIIPNKDLISKWIINWGHGRYAVGFEVNVRVDVNSDPDTVKKILVGVVQSNPIILKVPGIVARLEEIEENALFFLVRAFISARRVKEQWEISAALRTEMIKAFKEHGVEFAKPARVIELAHNKNSAGEVGPIKITFDRPV